MILEFAAAGANYITFHPEASKHVDRSLDLIRAHGCKAGLAFNPATSLDHLEFILHKVDLILIMSVNPGFGGQKFIPQMLDKIKRAKSIIQGSGFDIRLAVDGGIKVDNIKAVAEAGADIFVAGTAIFGEKSYEQAISKMRSNLRNS